MTSNAATLTVTSESTSPSYGSGFSSAGLTLNGNAAINGTHLRLNRWREGRGGSAFFNALVNVQSFTFSFSLSFSSRVQRHCFCRAAILFRSF